VNLPDEQALHAMALSAWSLLDHIPGAHFLQFSSLLRPSNSLYLPRGQSRHAELLFAPLSVE
jgi:hypothetical protein